MDKTALRAQVRQLKRTMTPEEIQRRSAKLADAFFACAPYRSCQTLYGYLSYNQEVLTLPILAQALKDGKQVAVPKVFGSEMRFIILTDLSQIAPGYCNIPEPIADGPHAQDQEALVLMPGLAFDPRGRRIGYGGGFYDRFLEAEPNHPTVALCYDFQVFPELETEEHDRPVDLVLWA